MSEERIDAVIADATIAPADLPPKEEPKTEDQPAEGDPAKDADASIDKKFENLKTRLKRENRQLRAQYTQREQQLQAELEQLRKAQPQTKPVEQIDPNAPREDHFDNFGDFLKADILYKVKQEQQQGQKQQQEQQQTAHHQQWKAEREEAIVDLANKAIETIPDFQQTMSEHVEIVDSFPPYIEQAFLEADNAPMAFYALAKEGKLESLLTMTPMQVAMAIGRAQDRGEALAKTKQVTKAPAPMQSAKGSGTGSSKLLDNMTYAELKAAGYAGGRNN